MRSWSRTNGRPGALLIAARSADPSSDRSRSRHRAALRCTARRADRRGRGCMGGARSCTREGVRAGEGRQRWLTRPSTATTNGGFITVTTTSPPASGTYATTTATTRSRSQTSADEIPFRRERGRTAVTVHAVAGLARSGSGWPSCNAPSGPRRVHDVEHAVHRHGRRARTRIPRIATTRSVLAWEGSLRRPFIA